MNFYTFIFLFTFSFAFSQVKPIEFTEFTLNNGLHVILHEDNSTPIVAISVMYHVGSKNENPERTGMAHFFEHLLFEGSENISRGEFDDYIENSGGTTNGFFFFIRNSSTLSFFFIDKVSLTLWHEERMKITIRNKNIFFRKIILPF